MKTLTHDDLYRILDGAAILGSGGGGPKSIGEEFLKALLQLPPVQVIDPQDLDCDALAAIGAGVGSPIAAESGFPIEAPRIAFKSLEKQLQKSNPEARLAYILPGEVGPGNSFVPMAISAQLGLPLIDASTARRAIPSLTQCTFTELPISPIVLANKDTEVSFSAHLAAQAEPVMRAIISSGTFTEDAGIAFWHMNGESVQDHAVYNTLTYALDLGKALHAALEAKSDPVEAVRKFLGGYLLFTGEIIDSSESTEGGFDFGTIVLQDTQKNKMTIYNQNENLIAWVSDKTAPVAIGPDLISYVATDGTTFTNAELSLAKGKTIAVIGSPCTEKMRAPSILAAWQQSLAHLGYAGPYVPIEKLHAG